MKKIISKIALALVIISSMPMHAGLGTSIQDGTRSMLQTIGNNPGRFAITVGSFFGLASLSSIYNQYRQNKKIIENIEGIPVDDQHSHDMKVLKLLKKENNNLYQIAPIVSAFWLSVTAGLSYMIAKKYGSVGSKI